MVTVIRQAAELRFSFLGDGSQARQSASRHIPAVLGKPCLMKVTPETYALIQRVSSRADQRQYPPIQTPERQVPGTQAMRADGGRTHAAGTQRQPRACQTHSPPRQTYPAPGRAGFFTTTRTREGGATRTRIEVVFGCQAGRTLWCRAASATGAANSKNDMSRVMVLIIGTPFRAFYVLEPA